MSLKCLNIFGSHLDYGQLTFRLEEKKFPQIVGIEGDNVAKPNMTRAETKPKFIEPKLLFL